MLNFHCGIAMTRRRLLLSAAALTSSCVLPATNQGKPQNQSASTRRNRRYIKFYAPIQNNSVELLTNYINSSKNEGINEFYIALKTKGGSVDAGGNLYNLILADQKKNISFIMHNVNYVESMGCYVFLAADSRIASPGARFRFHAAFIQDVHATLDDLREDYESMVAIQTEMLKILKQRTSLTPGEQESFVKHDTTLTAIEAYRSGIIQKIEKFVPPTEGKYFWISDTDNDPAW